MIPLKLTARQVPPDGYRYRFPHDGYVVHAWDPFTWVQLARDHLRANNMEEPPDLLEQMEDQLCQTLEPGWCMHDDPNRPRPSLVLDWDDIQRGIATFTSWAIRGGGFVEKEEAERRALICSRCYLNTSVSGCSLCHAAALKAVQGRSTKYDNSLNACAVCKCLLKAKVWFPLSALDRDREERQSLYPEFCWLKKS